MKLSLVKQTPQRRTLPVTAAVTPCINMAGHLFYRFMRSSPKRHVGEPDYYDVPMDSALRLALRCNCYDATRYRLEKHQCKHQKEAEMRLHLHRQEDMYTLRMQGYTFPELGKAFGISKQAASALIWRYEYKHNLEPSLALLKQKGLMHLIHKRRHFTADVVRYMRGTWQRNERTIASLAEQFNTDYSTIWKIIHKRVYKEIE